MTVDCLLQPPFIEKHLGFIVSPNRGDEPDMVQLRLELEMDSRFVYSWIVQHGFVDLALGCEYVLTTIP